MAFPKASDVRELSTEALQARIVEAKRELFQLRFQKATGQMEKTHQFKHLRHELAQLMTVERERELAAAAGSPAVSATASNQEDE